MLTEEIKKDYNLSREAAKKLLGVSIRTLDRYIGAKKLSARIVNGRIWLRREELESFLLGKNKAVSVDSVYMSRGKMSIDNTYGQVDNMSSQVDNDDIADKISSNKRERPGSTSETYKNLYLEIKEELKEKQDRLEIANYRVGQLETQLRNTIPMLEYHREKYEQNKQAEELKNQLSESSNLLRRLTLNLKYERFSKRVFLIILLIILALQPLWLIRL